MPLTYSDFNVRRSLSWLSNGLKVVVYERPGAPIWLELLHDLGSRRDPEGLEGISHFLEHILTAGSKRFPGKDLLARHVEQFGGHAGGRTNPIRMERHISAGRAEHFDEIASVLADICAEPLLTEEKIENERSVILQELREWQGSAERRVVTESAKVVFNGTPYAHDVLGSEESLARIGLPELKDFYAAHAFKKGTTLMVVGGISAEAATAALERHFGGFITVDAQGEERYPIVPYPDSIARVPVGGTKSCHVYHGSRLDGLSALDRHHLRILRRLLAGGRSSRLMRALRYEKGIAYSAGGYLSQFPGADSFTLRTACAADKVGESVRIIKDELSLMAEQGPEAGELDAARMALLASLPFSLESVQDIADANAADDLFGWEENGIEEWTRAIEEVRPQDVARAARLVAESPWRYVTLCGAVPEGEEAV